MQSLKLICAEHGIPLVCLFRFVLPDDIVFGTHTVAVDRSHFRVLADGKPADVFGVGCDEAEAFADYVKSLRQLIMGHGETQLCDVHLVGRSLRDNQVHDVHLTVELAV